MDLITLDERNQPKQLIERYDSLIWTERYNTVGDFEIQTGNVDQFMSLIPAGTRLSLRETNHTMIAETHEITRPKNGPVKLSIKGRSFESILDRRVSVLNLATSEWLVVVRQPSDAAFYAIHKVCVEGSADPADKFPESQVRFITPSDYLSLPGPNRQYPIPANNLLQAVIDLISTSSPADPTTIPPTAEIVPHGIRSVRPNSMGTAIAVQIYAGIDRSDTVYFDGTRDMLNDGRYLFSTVGSANVAYSRGEGISAKLTQRGYTPTGFDRRVALIDVQTANAQALQAHGSKALSDAHITAMFDGSINQDISPYTYGIDYGLGDVVRLAGDYGLDSKARVTEYIRSEDASGQKAYPTLAALEEV